MHKFTNFKDSSALFFFSLVQALMQTDFCFMEILTSTAMNAIPCGSYTKGCVVLPFIRQRGFLLGHFGYEPGNVHFSKGKPVAADYRDCKLDIQGFAEKWICCGQKSPCEEACFVTCFYELFLCLGHVWTHCALALCLLVELVKDAKEKVGCVMRCMLAATLFVWCVLSSQWEKYGWQLL